MSDEIKRGLQSPLRRKLLMGMAALPAIAMLPRPSFADVPATSVVNTTGLAVTDTEVTVGILHSVTGTMAISETNLIPPEIMAELQEAADQAARGLRDPKAMAEACDEMDRISEEIRRQHGVLDIGVPAIRELRDGA